MRHYLLNFAVASAAIFTFSSDAAAQCGIDDQLSLGGCCDQVDLALPAFPSIGLQSQGIRWDACGLAAQQCLSVNLSPPIPTARCGVFDVQVSVGDCAGVPAASGLGTLDYTRTWTEVRPQSVGAPPAQYQVWRFLFKVDLSGSGLIGSSPVLPNSLGSCPSAFYYGHVDYAFDCVSNFWESSFSLYHGADNFSHGPVLSSCPSTLDPISSYAIVGPDTAANPFVPTDFLVQPGALQSEAVRKVDSPIPFACNIEERIASGTYNPVGFGCLSPPSLGSIHQSSIALDATGGCGSNFLTLNAGGGIIPWRRLVSTSLGQWTTPFAYPGEELLRADEGLFVYNDACVTLPPEFAIFYGVETLKGYDVLPGPTPSFIGSQHFVDLGTNWTAPLTGPISLPAVGTVNPSKYLIYVNPQ